MLTQEIYILSPDDDKALWLSGCGYINGETSRIETVMSSAKSDVYKEHKHRISDDNGNSWTDFQPVDNMIFKSENGGMVFYGGNYYFDTTLGILYHPVMRRIWHNVPFYTMPWDGENKHPFYDHSFIIENEDVDQLMKYEPGADWDPEKYDNVDFLKHNVSYIGNSVVFHEDGTAFFPLACVRIDEWKGFIVVMSRNSDTGRWTPSQPFTFEQKLSVNGLSEPDIALLKDGRILIVCRGGGGRKWYSISNDKGKTFGDLREFKYNDGSRFFSPASIHRFVRSSKNGKLYWLANIVPKQPHAGRPRYPLCVCEIDEKQTAVIKESLIVVDDRRESEPELLQLSNFQVLENRETLDIEIYMTRLGESSNRPHRSGVYKYTSSP